MRGGGYGMGERGDEEMFLMKRYIFGLIIERYEVLFCSYLDFDVL